MSDEIKTPKTHPDHHTVGKKFKYFGEIYYCESYDPKIGYWMKQIGGSGRRTNVSERAIGRTFHEIY